MHQSFTLLSNRRRGRPATSRHEAGVGGCRSWPDVRGKYTAHGPWQWYEYSISHWFMRTHTLSTQTSGWTWLPALRRLKGSTVFVTYQFRSDKVLCPGTFFKSVFWQSSERLIVSLAPSQAVRIWRLCLLSLSFSAFDADVKSLCRTVSQRWGIDCDEKINCIEITTLFICLEIFSLSSLPRSVRRKMEVVMAPALKERLGAAAPQRPVSATAPSARNTDNHNIKSI